MKEKLLVTVILLAGCTRVAIPDGPQEEQQVKNHGISSIRDATHCNVKEFNPEQDCAITKYLEEKTIVGYRSGGKNFCTYKVIAKDGAVQYIQPICEEYYVVDYKLRCGTPELKDACLNAGLGFDGHVDDNIEQEYLPYLRDGIHKCDPSCAYVKTDPKFLNTGEGYGGESFMTVTSKPGDTFDVWKSADFQEDTIGLHEHIPDKFMKMYQAYSRTDGPFKGGELVNWNQKRAEQYFGLQYDETMVQE